MKNPGVFKSLLLLLVAAGAPGCSSNPVVGGSSSSTSPSTSSSPSASVAAGTSGGASLIGGRDRLVLHQRFLGEHVFGECVFRRLNRWTHGYGMDVLSVPDLGRL